MTLCNWTSTPASQKWIVADGKIQQGSQCLTVDGTSVKLAACSGTAQQKWDTGRVNETLSKIKFGDKCLNFDGTALTIATCLQEDPKCILKRCYYSILQEQMWYLGAMNGQLISSFTNSSIPPLEQDSHVEVAPCNASDPDQQWDISNGGVNTTLKLRNQPKCVMSDFQLEDCSEAPRFNVNSPYGNIIVTQTGQCFDVYNFSGPAVQLERHCKKHDPGTRGSQNEEWTYNPSTGLINSSSTEACCGTPSRPIPHPLCLAAKKAEPPTMINLPYCMATGPSPYPDAPKPPPAVDHGNPMQVWAGPLANNDIAVGVLNAQDHRAKVTVHWSDIGLKSSQSAKVRDLINHKDLGTFTQSLTLSIGSHDAAALRVTPQ